MKQEERVISGGVDSDESMSSGFSYSFISQSLVHIYIEWVCSKLLLILHSIYYLCLVLKRI